MSDNGLTFTEALMKTYKQGLFEANNAPYIHTPDHMNSWCYDVARTMHFWICADRKPPRSCSSWSANSGCPCCWRRSMWSRWPQGEPVRNKFCSCYLYHLLQMLP